MLIFSMKQYYYNKDTQCLYINENFTQCLYINENFTQPFLCPAEAEPLKFENVAECLEFLKENNIEGSVCYKLY
jgi:hypothetical protein